MKLVVTIDTEEDNWGSYSPTDYSFKNIERLPALQALFDQYSVQPTYLITYPVATNEKSVRIMSDLLKEGTCEIGTHCHPWNTPPYEEESNEQSTMLCNLPDTLQYRKLISLHNTIKHNFGVNPVSFRAGRWGFSQEVAKNLVRLGYKIDTSVTPYTDWSMYCGPDYSNDSPQPYRMKWEDVSHNCFNHDLLEVPASVGYLQKNFSVCNRVLKFLRQKPLRRMRLTGLLYKLRLVNKVGLSPEVVDSREMILFAQRLMKNNYQVLNMFFHSPFLHSGLTPFVRTPADEKRFLKTIREFLVYARDSGIESIKLSESPRILTHLVTQSGLYNKA